MQDVYICDAIRTPVGRYGGSLASVRADDLGAVPLRALQQRNPRVDWHALDEVILGCANQSGEDNRNVARMSSLLSGLPHQVAAVTVNRLCASGLNAIGDAARAIRCAEAELMIAGGVESMSRAPYVLGKSDTPYGRQQELFDTTMGWRFVNPLLDQMFGTETMPRTAENLAEDFHISREDQDRFAFHSQRKAALAQAAGYFAREIVPVEIPQRRGEPVTFSQDEHLRETSESKLAKLSPLFADGSVTAGNASGINDGAAALLMASAKATAEQQLTPLAKVLGMATVGVEPRVMGIGPAPATEKLLQQTGHTLSDIDLFEFNEAFAAQVLACTRSLGLADDDPRINPQGGAIALGHPLGMSGARLVTSAVCQLQRTQGKLALCTMCVGVGQGVALLIERVE